MGSRTKVLISTPIALLIAYGVYHWRGHLIPPLVIAGIALSIGFCGLFVPSAFAAIERFFARFAALVAVGLTWLLLTPVFFLFFGLGHLFLVLRRQDPMHRAFPTQEPSYWVDRPPMTRDNYYLSQH